MPVALDANFLSILLHPNASVPLDPLTKAPIDRCKDRVQELINRLSKSKTKIIVPWPAIAEFMIFAYPDHQNHLEELRNSAHFELSEFGHMAAIELTELSAKNKKPVKATREVTWAKLKYDRQIVAIAIAKQCTAIYSTDKGLRAFAEKCGMDVYDIVDLPTPQPTQPDLFSASTVIQIDTAKERASEITTQANLNPR